MPYHPRSSTSLWKKKPRAIKKDFDDDTLMGGDESTEVCYSILSYYPGGVGPSLACAHVSALIRDSIKKR
jgi:hypothetical protein